MALYSNWNVLTLPIKADGKYKIGDTYHVLDEEYPKFWKFDGLVIRNIDYSWGVRLHFSLKDWLEAKPDIERLIQEYNELNERIGKLSNFLKNPNGVELSEKMMAVMGGQQVAMEEYSRKLWERMEMLGITSEDVMNPNYTGQNMSFGEALQALEAGKCVARKGWITTCFVVKQIDSDIPAEVVPKMQSLPQHAKNLLNAFGVGSISYRSQCLLVEQAGDGNGATNYVPDWVDMFAKDWFVLGGE